MYYNKKGPPIQQGYGMHFFFYFSLLDDLIYLTT